MANSEAIAWYVEEAQRLLEDQQRRADSLQTRAGQLAGFGAVFLALIAGNAAAVLHEAHSGLRLVIAVTLILAALCLTVSVSVAVGGVSARASNLNVSADELANYVTEPFLDGPDLWRVQVRALRALGTTVELAQKRADDELKSITVSLYAFLAGLGFAVVSVGTLIVELI